MLHNLNNNKKLKLLKNRTCLKVLQVILCRKSRKYKGFTIVMQLREVINHLGCIIQIEHPMKISEIKPVILPLENQSRIQNPSWMSYVLMMEAAKYLKSQLNTFVTKIFKIIKRSQAQEGLPQRHQLRLALHTIEKSYIS